MRIPRLLIACGAALCACGGNGFESGNQSSSGGTPAPADVAGSYQIAVTNGANGCAFGNWTEGSVAQGIPLDIVQDGTAVTATIGGAVGGLFDLWLGAHTFEGKVSSDQVEMVLHGTKSFTSSNCTYTILAKATATLTGDALQGGIEYSAATNGDPDCTSAGIQGCVTKQSFSGTRPP